MQRELGRVGTPLHHLNSLDQEAPIAPRSPAALMPQDEPVETFVDVLRRTLPRERRVADLLQHLILHVIRFHLYFAVEMHGQVT